MTFNNRNKIRPHRPISSSTTTTSTTSTSTSIIQLHSQSQSQTTKSIVNPTSFDYITNANDSDDELCPPALSPYAINLAEGIDKSSKSINSKINNRPNDISLKNSTFNSISQSKSISNSNTNLSKHSRFLSKLGLGAPRRLSDSEPNGNNDDKDTNKDQIMRKRNVPLTPNKPSIINKKVNQNGTPYKKDDSQLLNTPVKKNQGSNLSLHSNLDIYETPEVGREVLNPLSSSKLNSKPIDLFNINNMNNIYNKENILELDLNLNNSHSHSHSKVKKAKQLDQLDQLLLNKKESSKNYEIKSEVKFQDQDSNNKIVEINKHTYKLLEQIGKGGSSKVFRSIKDNNNRQFLAIKIVNFEDNDDHEIININDFKGEIKILNKLKNNPRVVKLIDYKLTTNSIYFVMECGEIDLAHIFSSKFQSNLPFDIEFIRFYSLEILRCIEAIHKLNIVHSDLKPANFLLVKGILKLIDFGISNSISNQTVNIYRDCQMGTPNYMAPETLIDVSVYNNENNENAENNLIWKIGKPSDIWSCGCIIYQMAYGKPPYSSFNGTKKILAITNPKINISYPRMSNGIKINNDLLEAIKSCLIRDPLKRSSIDRLLGCDFFNPKNINKKFIDELIKNAIKYGSNHPNVNEKKIQTLVENVWKKIDEFS